jgi:hypothetical protein
MIYWDVVILDYKVKFSFRNLHSTLLELISPKDKDTMIIQNVYLLVDVA